ncbi:MAG TPA: gliding motility-associated C-terminal domain-containing protein, partial [Williamwhitmania sp.]|nr:gliding motility-associated C-terminal domain-containing protein [Williamwhitmania sp.]
MTLIFSVKHSAGQNLPSACVGTVEKYGVKGLNGTSIFSWSIVGPGGFTVPSVNIQVFAKGDSIAVTWDNNFVGGVYSFMVTETTPWGCVGAPYEQDVVINSPTIFVPVGALPELLKFCQNGNITIDPGSSYKNYLWQDGSKDQTFITNTAGTYRVRLIGADYSCSYDTTQVTINPLPVVNLGRDTSLCGGQALMLDAYNSTVTSYLWSSGDITSNLLVGAGLSQNIWVQVTDENGCVNSDSIKIGLCDPNHMRIPYVFTPNGDGANDKWEIPDFVFFTDVDIRVYNRYGKEV